MTRTDGHDWITIHRMRFPAAISARDRVFSPVAGAAVWRFCPQHTPGGDGLVTLTSDIWGALGIWGSRAEAEAMLDDPGAAMPWLAEALDAWHCLAIPVTQRGKVNWRGQVEDGTAIRPSPADPGRPLVVVTSAGFLSRGADMLPRIRRFVAGVSEVMAWYGALPSNLRNDVFNGPDGREGFTCSLWRSDEAMREAAYRDGRHRTRIGEYNEGMLMDYSSFTRLRALRCHGSWDGDPFARHRQDQAGRQAGDASHRGRGSGSAGPDTSRAEARMRCLKACGDRTAAVRRGHPDQWRADGWVQTARPAKSRSASPLGSGPIDCLDVTRNRFNTLGTCAPA